MNLIQRFTDRLATVTEVFTFLWRRRQWWLVPLAVLLLLMGVLFAVAQVSSVAPWMYAL